MKKKAAPTQRRQIFVQQITDINLAVFLASCGVPLRKNMPFSKVRMADKSERVVFSFDAKASDGTPTADLIEMWKNPVDAIAAAPDSTVAGALSALSNWAKFHEVINRAKPWVFYKVPKKKAAYMVIAGSKREALCIKRGFVQVDPFEEIPLKQAEDELKGLT